MSSAPPGIVEAGAPSFVVTGPEALGLDSAPSDLHVLPDGRILVVSQHDIAFGDGVRWDAFREADGEPPIFSMVAVDNDGGIYVGLNSGIDRVELDESGRWSLKFVVNAPAAAVASEAGLNSVEEFPDQWYWYGGKGAIVSWKPGREAAVAGRGGDIERIFVLGKETFFSDGAGLFRLKANGAAVRVLPAGTLVSDRVTCTIPFGRDQLLVGTGSEGLKLFNGETFRPFGPGTLLNNGHRITDLSPAGAGFFAAAVDTVGIVFFDRDGRTVQVLERSLDHRLGRVRLLRYSSFGVLWALLEEGVARIEFPSPISHFEPLIPSGLDYAQPVRHDGRLWVLADGRAMRASYDAAGRLDGFADDSPPGRYLFTLSDVDGQLFGANEKGICVYGATGWRSVLPGIVNARVGVAKSADGGISYVARGEYGVIRRNGPGYRAQRIRLPSLGDSYGNVEDSAGIGWIELGVSKIGRFDARGAMPALRVLGAGDGLGGGWIEAYLIDGIARFHWAGHVYRFDNAQGRFVDDKDLLSRFPALEFGGGRPVTDMRGRLWMTIYGTTTQVIDLSAPSGDHRVQVIPVGFAPSAFTAEDDGVIWMFVKGRLARMDPRIPSAPAVLPRALITSVQLAASNRQLFAPAAELKPLDYADNSLVIHFAAPGNPFAAPISFEVLLQGLGSQWVSTGTAGLAAFNHLKEGDYTFRVRPVAGGVLPGEEARLRFTVRPPWYRSPLAWVSYFAAAAGAFAFALWLSSYLQRRENARLERLVALRTGQLNATNAQLGRQIAETTQKSADLAVSEERYRLLNAELEKRVAERTAQLETTLEQLAQARKMEAVGQLAGGIAHDYNNILTATLMQIGLLTADPAVTGEVRSGLNQLEAMAKRAASLTRRLLTFSRQQVVQVHVIDVEEVVENLLKLLRSLLPENIVLTRNRAGEPLWVDGDPGLIEQVITNLCVNARDAMVPRGGRLTIGTGRVTIDADAASSNLEARPGKFVRLVVEDEGCGMDAATLKHIFEPFFTTKEMGTGLGLATVYGIAKQHHGWVEVRSEVGRGSAFQVFLPEARRPEPPASRAAAAGAQRGRECILLVEDESAVRQVAALTLKRVGYRILEAVDGEDAIRVWSEHSREIDLLFSDMVMPKGISGIDLAKRFKAERPGLKVVITSGYSVDLTDESILGGPGCAFLAKPYLVEGLTEVLRTSLDSATP